MKLRTLMPWLMACSLAAPVAGTAKTGQAAVTAPTAPVNGGVPPAPLPPAWQTTFDFGQLGMGKDTLLSGINNRGTVEFRLRRDRLATAVTLHLHYTPSPSLLPGLSHLRIYLNDQLMDTVPITKEQIGQSVDQEVTLDPRLVRDFNRVRVEFVGHYTDICENPAHSSLWLNLGQKSQLLLGERALALGNDLAYFPLPFFDERDFSRVELPMVFAQTPSLGEQRAATILASYFGAKAGWRGTRFPVSIDQLPAVRADQPQPVIVFATNEHRPAFMADYERFPRVEGAVIQMLDYPGAPTAKLLLVMGRDEADLALAASALATESDLLRGSRVRVDRVAERQPRQPYDAPNWMRTDRPVRFAELIGYPEQLQASGLQPSPIQLDISLPPDLFVWRNHGIPLKVRYRYTPPLVTDESRLNISANGQYVSSIALKGSDADRSQLEQLRLEVTSSDATAFADNLLIPALKIGDHNRLEFNFNFATTLGNSREGSCRSFLPVETLARIDENSSIDFSGYYHYMAMPDLRAFARSGFPFSRMADLSETLVLVPPQASPLQIATLMESVALISAQTGYPAFGLHLESDWAKAENSDADLLLLGPMPQALREREDLNLLLARPADWLRQAKTSHPAWQTTRDSLPPQGEPAETEVTLSAQAPIAAIVGLESPFSSQRSIVALLASSPEDYRLLREALGDSGKRNAMAGSVVLIRSSGVSSQQVGERYFVGHLPWWLLLWFHLSGYPLVLAACATGAISLFAVWLWRALRQVARRRLEDNH